MLGAAIEDLKKYSVTNKNFKKMITGKEPVYPQIDTDIEFADVNNEKQYSRTYNHTEGLSLRQYYAGLALQGLMTTLLPASGNGLCPNLDNVKYMSDLAVTAADELIKALNK